MSNSEFRQDIVSNDWILLARSREDYFKKVFSQRKKKAKKLFSAKSLENKLKKCPFETPEKTGHQIISQYPKNGKNWFIKVIPNKYSAISAHFNTCPFPKNLGPYFNMEVIGFQEIVITKDHFQSIALLNQKEISLLINAYKQRYLSLAREKCLKYIFIFHNSGQEAGASVEHPHSQIMALPTIPSDVSRSLEGCKNYFEKHKKCAHCVSLEFEREKKERIIFQNSDFIALAPYASRVNFEIRIFPLKHNANFESISPAEIEKLSEMFKNVFQKIYKRLENPAYNFFIHTAPLFDNSKNYKCYHWHIEIFPRVFTWAGFELGTGMEVVYISPEKSAKILCG